VGLPSIRFGAKCHCEAGTKRRLGLVATGVDAAFVSASMCRLAREGVVHLAPTGRAFSVQQMTIERLEDDRIVDPHRIRSTRSRQRLRGTR
jgi:hypothetical protein